MKTLNVFKSIVRLEEQMIRASMPRTSAADPKPTTPWVDAHRAVVASRSGSRLVRPLTYTLAEVAVR